MEAKWARLAAAGVFVVGLAACGSIEPPKNRAGKNTASTSDYFVDATLLYPTDCRGDVELRRMRWELYNMGKKGADRRPIEDFAGSVLEKNANEIKDAFNRAACGDDSYPATHPAIQNDTVNPCNDGEITIREANRRLRTAGVPNSLNRKRLGADYRNQFCPQATATPDRS